MHAAGCAATTVSCFRLFEPRKQAQCENTRSAETYPLPLIPAHLSSLLTEK